MTKKLSYPGLKCVLEYLEANRRIYITARSPALRRIEKLIPIHLEYLMISNNIALNCISIQEVYSDTNIDNQIEFRKGEKSFLRQYPMHLTYEKAAERMHEYYLGGRMNIYADHFWFSYIEEGNFSQFNVTTNELTIHNFLLNDILEYINPDSFPLKELSIDCIDDFNHPHIRSAKKLCVEISDDQRNEYSTRINAIQNQNTELEYDTLEWTDVMGIIRYWMENGKETGTTLVCKGYGDPNDEIMTKLRKEFREILSELIGINDQFPNVAPGFSIPLNSSSKIVVYGWRISENIPYAEIVLKVVSSQTDDNIMVMENQ
ncbi:hypothetical protein CRE_09660 [Caenorhabditis remanei]|uniref:F-box associated domain-containing protein n=1 Tax=Caenorhabditis remanei TaxID=31234 RepID=E3MX32_CAERE|nr:hypothetical protein CRE_09660 [Caenorhabditis remanei]